MAVSIIINGKKEEFLEELSIADFLNRKNIKKEVVAIELNDNVVDKGSYDSTILKNGDALEFVYYMGGGSLEDQPKKCGKSVADSVLDLIGNTPLLRLNKIVEPGMAQILGKLESANPGGSVKDRIALNMIEDAEKKGKIKSGATIVEPTSGNTGIGLAMIAATKGYKCILTMPESMSLERVFILKSYGAEVVLTPAIEGMSGAIKRAEALLKKIPGSFMPQQFKNSANPEMHRKTTAQEILEATEGKLDAFVAGVGTGGTITGVSEILKKENPDIKVIGVEPSTSAVLSGKSAGPHKIQGIGAGFVPEVLNRRLIDEVIQVDDDEAFRFAKRLAKEEGLFVGISSGAAASAAIKVAKDLGNGKTVVVVLPDTGERYFSMEQFFEG
jgi:cysteine synthase A